MNDYFLYALPWMWIGGWIGAITYRDLEDQFPWQWFQGQVKARVIVLAVIIGVCWPGSLILAAMSRVPGLRRWLIAFIQWRRPANEAASPPVHEWPHDWRNS